MLDLCECGRRYEDCGDWRHTQATTAEFVAIPGGFDAAVRRAYDAAKELTPYIDRAGVTEILEAALTATEEGRS